MHKNTMSSQNHTHGNVEIQTFVFFDLETTGLIEGSSMPKITEISLVASSRDSFLLDKDHALPRVLHKLTIPLQPLRFIPLIVSQITGLYNDLLEHEKPFDDQVYVLLNSFIGRLHPPVCFVAHNGNRFDYPILLSALDRIGKTLSADILSIDSLNAFKGLYSHNGFSTMDKSVPPNTVADVSKLFDDGNDAELAAVVDAHSITSTPADMEGVDTLLGVQYELDANHQSMQRVNEKTPTHQINNLRNKMAYKLLQNVDGLPAKKRLPFTYSKPANFKLDTVYKHLVGSAPVNSHSAEGDCLSLLVCAMKIGESFIRWADSNARPLKQCAIEKK